ncbi:MAG: ribose 5-phosphate isomerase B [Anaerolineae bacterium]|nr:ribose 5-phosphate isomerase B [Anaerolineae bacterium]MCX8068402.1 ribose 5-phosphate isomerase B [Anaerolineae bacterium]MDW7991562.1 ribose 5-phosphate isomerase B [Anaerolineae bacterium]
MERIAIGADHAGRALKEEILVFLRDAGYSVEDMGTYGDESVDYPDYALKVARAVATGAADLGILICGTGIGMSIAANKVRGVRAAVATDCYMARMAREHNDANILCLGGRVVGAGLALDIVQTFLQSRFAGGRHVRRIGKIRAAEESSSPPLSPEIAEDP